MSPPSQSSCTSYWPRKLAVSKLHTVTEKINSVAATEQGRSTASSDLVPKGMLSGQRSVQGPCPTLTGCTEAMTQTVWVHFKLPAQVQRRLKVSFPSMENSQPPLLRASCGGSQEESVTHYYAEVVTLLYKQGLQLLPSGTFPSPGSILFGGSGWFIPVMTVKQIIFRHCVDWYDTWG